MCVTLLVIRANCYKNVERKAVKQCNSITTKMGTHNNHVNYMH